MFCRTCGKPVNLQAVACTNCGCPPMRSGPFCSGCGKEVNPAAVMCPGCGVALNAPSPLGIPGVGTGMKSRVLAGILNLIPLLGIPVGGIGRLYLGYTGIGVAQLLLTFVCVGWIWSIIDGILILTGSVPTDADGRPLSS